MIRQHRTQQAIALFVSDIVAIALAFSLAYWLRFTAQYPVPVIETRAEDVPTFAVYARSVLLPALVVLPLGLASAGLYRVRRVYARIETYIHLAAALSFGTLAVAAIVSLVVRPEQLVPVAVAGGVETVRVTTWTLSRWFLLFFYLGTTVLMLTGRVAIQKTLDRARRSGRNLKQILIAGDGPLAQVVIDRMRMHEEFGFRMAGMLTSSGTGESYRGVDIAGSLADAKQLVRERSIDQIYVALPLSAHEEILQLLRDVSHEVVDIKVVPDLLQYITLGAGVEDLDGVPIVNLSRIPMEGLPAFTKRAIDILAAGSALLLFAPLFPLIAAAVKLTSKGPVLFRQERMGLDGRSFNLLKFRSMVMDAEVATGPVWASEQDSRCTPIGAALRKLSLDELPQFWNIIRGDMSLVGPRPERPFFVDEFREQIPHYMHRHRVRAGLTGWAQVHGWRGNTSLNKRIEYDLYYIENWSLALDIKILWMTVTNGMVHEHAY
ncbi:MAG: undecaprenyl-phosphate glucose phosphotransferase [Acidobacteria bacterium]|nr:undecaprenyl-phosphate glucose phosphotransferase [Acidobacteriota bacterium]